MIRPEKEVRIRVTFLEEVLGTASNNPEIHSEFIASLAPDAMSKEEEVAAIGADEVVEKSMTVFPKMEDGTPFFWDYQWKGYFKDSCGMLKKATGSESANIKAYKKEIDGLIFIKERKIPIMVNGEIGHCQRPLRGQTAQGERISLANSEAIPAGSTCEFTIMIYRKGLWNAVEEWLDYGIQRGTGQWRNSGKGRFKYEIIEADSPRENKPVIVENAPNNVNESEPEPAPKRRGRPKKSTVTEGQTTL